MTPEKKNNMKIPKPTKDMDNLLMGDMTIKDDNDLGLSIHAKGKKLTFINALGEIALMEWIAEKYGRPRQQVSQNMSKLRKEIERAINRNSAENGSDTPDFILAEYLTDCLSAYDRAVVAREKWHGRQVVSVESPIDIEAVIRQAQALSENPNKL